ncbi:con-10 family general stress protein [Gluconacetobacter liquefaciens]|uniref:General stress protein n=1 Tax=Gluconacetobacter liquefaciens TaxID=89584 RepID=A0A370GAF5_GLULI|nr:general stress protein [Gluconacetobacter liquefaciens]MBB2185376.1 general stress protein [Gluconacetobacter liquefaciens]RDI40822.1 hypothetical protein C7453_101621 [Gluconacetobacter liquefaciens]
MISLEKYHSFLVRAADKGGSSGGSHNPGHFTQDREKAAEAGRKGGQHSHGNVGHSAGGAEHKAGNFADDPEKAAEAGRKGGHASHSHKGA